MIYGWSFRDKPLPPALPTDHNNHQGNQDMYPATTATDSEAETDTYPRPRMPLNRLHTTERGVGGRLESATDPGLVNAHTSISRTNSVVSRSTSFGYEDDSGETAYIIESR